MAIVTLKDVALHAGVSRQAVGSILGDRGHLFRQGTRNKVFASAKALGYRPNAAAKTMNTRRTMHVGVLVLNSAKTPIVYPQTYYTILGMNMALESAGYVLSLVRIGDVEQELAGGSRVFREQVLDGLLVTTSIPDTVTRAIETLVPHTVWVDTNVWRPEMCVRRDERDAGRVAAEQAIAAGYKKVLLFGDRVDSDDPHYSHAERAQGVVDACRSAKVKLSRVDVSWRWKPALLAELKPFLRPDVAVIASDVARARLVAQASMLTKRTPGEDFGLVCCESVPEVNYGWPDLACVEFDRLKMGSVAAQMMLAALDSADQTKCLSVCMPSAWCGGTTLGPARPA